MKRLLSAVFALVLVCAMCVIPASAADSYELIPTEGTWIKEDNGGATVNIEYQDDAVVFSGSVLGTWPAAEIYYAEDARIAADIDEYSLVYDFSIDTGNTNINFYFTDGFGSSASYTICNNTLGNVAYESGSGDLMAGDYKGVVRLSDFVNSTKFFNSEGFPQNMITLDNEIIFTGIQVYSVNGAVITVRQLDIVPNDEAGDPTGGATGGEEPGEDPAESSEAPAESSEVPAESSEVPAENSKTESNAVSTEASENTDVEPEEEGLGVWLWVIIGAAVVVVVVVIVVVAKNKK